MTENSGQVTAPMPAATAVAPVIAPRPPGWWQRNWKWAVPTGAVVLVGGFVGFVALLVALVFGVIKNTEVYETAVYEAKLSRPVIEAIGAPIEEGALVMGNIEVSVGSGYAELAIPIEGPEGRATVYVEAEKMRGEWIYSTLVVSVHDSGGGGAEIDLLAGR